MQYMRIFRKYRHQAIGVSSFALAAMQLLCVDEAKATEVPVNMCTSGATTGTPLPTGGSGGNVSYTPPTATASLAKNTGSNSGQARVDPGTAALVYEKTDLSIGNGDFPSSLTVNRVFNSRKVRDTSRPAYRAGGSIWYSFGFGSTHNLDIRFEASEIFFGTDRYGIISIRIGFDSVTFQKCASGYVNMKRDGSRLYTDSTFSNGLRYETRDGHKLYFETAPQSSHATSYYCGGSTRSLPVCGYVRRWEAPNGDRADFTYERYYSHPTNEATVGGFNNYAMTGQGSATQCHVNTKGVQDCRDINQPWYVMTNGQTYAIGNFPIYDYRLTEVVNSRGYRLTFQYVDPTTDVGGLCGTAGTNLNCTSPAKNVTMERNRIASVTGWLWNGSQYQQLSVVQYGYLGSSGYNENYLRTITDASGNVTRIAGLFDLYEPGQSVAAIKPTWTYMFDDYYYPHTDEVHSTADYYVRTTLYPAISSLKRGNDAPVQYTPTLAGRWLPDAYGRWRWETFISRMQASNSAGATTYDYLDDNLDDHYGPSRVTDAVGGVDRFEYTSLGTLANKTSPEGIKVTYTYDVRGNLLSQRTDPKPGSSELPTTTRAAYVGGETLAAEQCPMQATCNRMLWSEDALANRSDYEWDAGNGGIRRTLGPVLNDGSRQETTVDYAAFAGMSGTLFSLPVDFATRISASQWKHDVIEYGSDTRHLPIGVAQNADGMTLRTCRRYNLVGDVISETLPRAGLAACPQ